MPVPNDIPGYVQGFRFNSDAANYTAGTQTFLDKSPYNAHGNDLSITVGTPVFQTVGAEEGLRLNNTFYGYHRYSIPYHGSCIIVLKPIYVGGASLTRMLSISREFSSWSANGTIRLSCVGGNRNIQMVSANASLTCGQGRTDDNTVVVALSHDQSTRKGYASADGVTIVETTAAASTTQGLALGLRNGLKGMQFGNMSATEGDVTEMTDGIPIMFEQHFFSTNILSEENKAATAAVIADLKTQYGAS